MVIKDGAGDWHDTPPLRPQISKIVHKRIGQRMRPAES